MKRPGPRVSTLIVMLLTMGPVSCATRAPHAAPARPVASIVPSSPPAVPAPPAPAPARVPDRLSDAEFWAMVTAFSETNGQFRSDNLLSNEVRLQSVIPDLLAAATPGRVYMGVGPEQNFTYIAALKPAMAIVVDVRRGNLDIHLMYKALFEMSADRIEFLSRLFSRRRPEGLTAASSLRDIFTAYASAAADEALFEENVTAIINHLQKTHGFPLEPEDVPGIRYVYGFFGRYGPALTYWMSGASGSGRGGFRNSPTYADLALASDSAGVLRSYLATEENFATLKALESKNLVVPLVGNFAGPRAIRAVGEWLKAHQGVVSAFYLSNVEQYLNADGLWMDFCANASSLPMDGTSQFIRSYRGGGPGWSGGQSGGGGLTQALSPMLEDLEACAGSRRSAPGTVTGPAAGPRRP